MGPEEQPFESIRKDVSQIRDSVGGIHRSSIESHGQIRLQSRLSNVAAILGIIIGLLAIAATLGVALWERPDPPSTAEEIAEPRKVPLDGPSAERRAVADVDPVPQVGVIQPQSAPSVINPPAAPVAPVLGGSSDETLEDSYEDEGTEYDYDYVDTDAEYDYDDEEYDDGETFESPEANAEVVDNSPEVRAEVRERVAAEREALERFRSTWQATAGDIRQDPADREPQILRAMAIADAVASSDGQAACDALRWIANLTESACGVQSLEARLLVARSLSSVEQHCALPELSARADRGTTRGCEPGEGRFGP